jgi:acetyl esterase
MPSYEFRRSLQTHRATVAKLSPSPTLPRATNIKIKKKDRMTIYTPLNYSPPYATVLYLPGNAFIASEQEYTNFICGHIAEKSGCQIIVVQHRLAPEFPFPSNLKDASQFLKILLKNKKVQSSLHIDPQRFAIAGYSSGGNLSALLSLQAKDNALSITCQILVSPVMDLSRTKKGFEQFEQQDNALSESFVRWFLDLYIPKNLSPQDPVLSPYWLENQELKKFPPTYFLFGELDRFRGDSELSAEKLTSVGNIAHKVMFEQANHGLLWNNFKVILTTAKILYSTFHLQIEKPLCSLSDPLMNGRRHPFLPGFSSFRRKNIPAIEKKPILNHSSFKTL